MNAAGTLPQYEIIYSKMEILEDGSCIVDEIQVLECDPAGNTATL